MPQRTSLREVCFREGLAALIRDANLVLPWGLREALEDHLYRHDSQGYSLCFHNPERERLCAELTPILRTLMEAP